MKSISLTIDLKAIIGFLSALLIGIVLFRSPILQAQSASTLSGTFACLTNKNMAGYTAAATSWTNADVNSLFIVTFDGNGSGTVSGLIQNEVQYYETTSAITASKVNSTPIILTVTSNTPSQYLYKVTTADGLLKPNYIALTNSGNTLFC